MNQEEEVAFHALLDSAMVNRFLLPTNSDLVPSLLASDQTMKTYALAAADQLQTFAFDNLAHAACALSAVPSSIADANFGNTP